MATHPSPGVYSQIIDLSAYVGSIPSTVAYIPVITDRGPDNQIVTTNARDFFRDFGKPNINYCPKDYSQQMYLAAAFLGQSDALYTVRVMPEDALYANLMLSYDSTPTPDTTNGQTFATVIDSGVKPNSYSQLAGELEVISNPEKMPLVVFHGIGRGDYYKNFKIEIRDSENRFQRIENQVYDLFVYEKQSTRADGDTNDVPTEAAEFEYSIVESFEVSFDINYVDPSGDSKWIVDVINMGSSRIRCMANEDNVAAAIVDNVSFSYPFSLPIALGGGGGFSLEGSFKNFDAWDPTELKKYMKRAFGGGTVADWLKNPITDEFLEDLKDKQFIYFSLCFVAGDPDVVSAAVQLAKYREDFMLVADNKSSTGTVGENTSVDKALKARNETNKYNTKYAALYEPYSKVNDSFTGRDLWLTPVFHMASIFPYNDRVADINWAAAGFNRGTIDGIKDVRFNPRLDARDLLYARQINPIVRFPIADVVYGQLTTQVRPTALQDINIVRVVMSIRRALEEYCQFYLFELNDSETWNEVATEINTYLDIVKNKRWLYEFNVAVGATDAEIKRKWFHCDVMLRPTRVVEQIHLRFFIK